MRVMTLAPRTIELAQATHTRITFAPDKNLFEALVPQMSHASVPLIESLKATAKEVGLTPIGLKLAGTRTLEAAQDLSWVLLSSRVENSEVQALVDANFGPILDRLVITPSQEGKTVEQLRHGDGIKLVMYLLDDKRVVWEDTILRVVSGFVAA